MSKVVGFDFNDGAGSVATFPHLYLDSLLNKEKGRVPVAAIRGVEKLLGMAHRVIVEEAHLEPINGVSDERFYNGHEVGAFGLLFRTLQSIDDEKYFIDGFSKNKNWVEIDESIRQFVDLNRSLLTLAEIPESGREKYERLNRFYKDLSERGEHAEYVSRCLEDEDDD